MDPNKLKAKYPDEYARFVKSLKEAKPDLSEDELEKMALKFLGAYDEIRKADKKGGDNG